MKRLVLLLLILPLVGCLPKAMQNAHEQEGVTLYAYQVKADELHEALLKDFELEAGKHLDTIEAWLVANSTVGGNISVERLNEIKAQRIAVERFNADKYTELREKWGKNYGNFSDAMKLHSAIAEWLAFTGLF